MKVNAGDALYVYVFLSTGAQTPSEVMVQWHDGAGWEHRAYWGSNLINWGTNGTASRAYMGALPAAGGWVRLEVPASVVGLEGATVKGMSFVLYNGQGYWDRAGKRSATWLTTKYYTFNGQRIAMRDENGLTYLHSDHLGSTVFATNASGQEMGRSGYRAYGGDRGGIELATEYRYTGQKGDGTGLMYYNSGTTTPASAHSSRRIPFMQWAH